MKKLFAWLLLIATPLQALCLVGMSARSNAEIVDLHQQLSRWERADYPQGESPVADVLYDIMQQLLVPHQSPQRFCRLDFSQETPGAVEGINTVQAEQLWHSFPFSCQQPFKRWLKALGGPLPGAVFDALCPDRR